MEETEQTIKVLTDAIGQLGIALEAMKKSGDSEYLRDQITLNIIKLNNRLTEWIK
jgi:hypothetical protein